MSAINLVIMTLGYIFLIGLGALFLAWLSDLARSYLNKRDEEWWRG